jgi:hypothetical protein
MSPGSTAYCHVSPEIDVANVTIVLLKRLSCQSSLPSSCTRRTWRGCSSTPNDFNGPEDADRQKAIRRDKVGILSQGRDVRGYTAFCHFRRAFENRLPGSARRILWHLEPAIGALNSLEVGHINFYRRSERFEIPRRSSHCCKRDICKQTYIQQILTILRYPYVLEAPRSGSPILLRRCRDLTQLEWYVPMWSTKRISISCSRTIFNRMPRRA